MRAQSDQHLFTAALTQLSGVLASNSHAPAPASDNPLIQSLLWAATRFGIAPIRVDALIPNTALTPQAQLYHWADILGVGIREVEWLPNSETICGTYLVFDAQTNSPGILLAEGMTPTLWTPSTSTPQPLQLQDQFKREAYQLIAPLPNRPLTWRDFIRFGLSHAGKPSRMVLFSTAIMATLALVFPIALGYLVDHIIPNAHPAPLFQLMGWLLLVVINMALFQWARAMILLRATAGMDNALQSGLWLRILQLPLPFFRRFSVGDLAQRANSIPDLRRFISVTQISLLISGVFSLAAMSILAVLDWRLFAQIMMLLLPVSIGFGLVLWVQIRGAQDISQWESRLTGLFVQLMRGMAKLTMANAQKRAFSVWATGFSVQKSLTFRLKKLKNGVDIFALLLPSIGLFLLFINFGMVKNHPFSIGQFVIFSSALGQALAGISSIFASLLAISPIVGTAKSVLPILAETPETLNRRNYLSGMTGAIELVQVGFTYPGMPPLLEEISFKIEPGQFVAIVGPSGSGKSTLFRLLLGFETPQSGAIYIDGVPLSTLDLASVRRQFGVVLQSADLFSGDILSNVIGTSSHNIERAWYALRIAGLEDEIKAMPMGVHTLISDTASTFSGGQKQRLILARALVNQPKCLFLDEATSALDNATQQAITERLTALSMTRIVIAHRLSTIRNADLIIVMDKGKVVEQGNYDTLVARNRLFTQLATRQL